MRIILVIPTYNEAENIPGLLSALFRLPLADLRILIVDDGSPDGTAQIVRQIILEYPGRLELIERSGKFGLGSAYIQGMQWALENGADAIGQMDADFSHPPELLVDLIAALPGCDLALGSRYIAGGGVDEDWPTWRKRLSAFGNFYARTILGLRVRDVTGGYRVWQREALLAMPLEQVQSNGYAFLIEMLYMAHRLGYKFQEGPFYFADRTRGNSKMSLRIQVEAAWRVWQMRSRYRNVKPTR